MYAKKCLKTVYDALDSSGLPGCAILHGSPTQITVRADVGTYIAYTSIVLSNKNLEVVLKRIEAWAKEKRNRNSYV